MLPQLKVWFPRSLLLFSKRTAQEIIFALPLAVVVILLRLVGGLQGWELRAFDLYLRWRPQEVRDERIAIVGINEQDLHSLNQGAIYDRDLARLITKLKRMEPRGIGLDIYRDLPLEPGHEELVRVYQSTPNLIGIQKLVGDEYQQKVAPPPELKAQGQIGANDLKLDPDNVLRRGYLRVGGNSETLESFALYLAALYLAAEGIAPKVSEGTNIFQFKNTVFPRFQNNDGGYVSADAKSYQTIINYRGAANHFEIVSLTDVLQDRLAKDWGRNRLILIGYVSESFQDIFPTPHTTNSSERMSGVEIHANLISQIISAVIDNRPLIKTLSESLEYGWILLWWGVGTTIAIVIPQAATLGKSLVVTIVGIIIAAGAIIGITYILFLQSWWLPVIPPLMALVGSPLAIVTAQAYKAIRIRQTFGRYLSNDVVKVLLEDPEGLKLGGENRRITILVSDIRGFSLLASKIPPEIVVKILNLYLETMSEIIFQYGGTIDEFMGDGILALFGAPLMQNNHAERAVATALAMQQAMKSVNDRIATVKDLPDISLEMGISINTGEVVVGNIGSKARSKYGIVGHQVNLTYRIESYTVGGQILISENTYQELGDKIKIDGSERVFPKGVQQPITVYSVVEITGKYNLSLQHTSEVLLTLPEPVAIQYFVIQEYNPSETSTLAKIVRLAPKTAEILDQDWSKSLQLSTLENIKILFGDGTDPDNYLFAKVIETKPEFHSFTVRFTGVPQGVKMMLAQYLNIKH